MKINKITDASFNGKSELRKRFLTPYAQKDVQSLLREMNHRTVYKENKNHTSWVSEILSRISIDEKVSFTDNRLYVAPVKEPKEFNCDCTLQIGKTKLNINSSTGEIVSYKKGWFCTWHSIYEQAANYLKGMLANIDNPEIVKKHSFSISGFTQKGAKILQDCGNRLNYYRNL